MIYALVNRQTMEVENIVVLDEGAVWAPPDGVLVIALQNGFGIGDTWDGNTFVRAVPTNNVPDSTQVISTGTQSL